MRWSNSVAAVAVVLGLIVIGAIALREQCRLGDARMPICDWMGLPHIGGPFRLPDEPANKRALKDHAQTHSRQEADDFRTSTMSR